MKSFKEKEDAFSELLHRTAREKGMVFIEESGEGHEFETDDMFLEDVAGWLFPSGTPESKQRDAKWFVFAEWEIIEGDVVKKFVNRDNGQCIV